MPRVMFFVDMDRVDFHDGYLRVLLPQAIIDIVRARFDRIEPGQRGRWKFVFDVHRKTRPRTTGERSQNHRINGHIQAICMETGDDFYFMKEWVKYKAIRRGYPFDTAPDGTVIPWSETRLTTVQAAMLCEEIEQFAAERNIRLPEYPDHGEAS